MKKDFLICGAGLAGCLLAWSLEKHNKTFSIIDDPATQSSSEIAAGIINPITGKRFTLLDQFPTYFKQARNLYTDLGDFFDQSFLKEIPIIRIFKDAKEQTFWNGQRGKPEQQSYLKQYNPGGVFQRYIHDSFGSLVFNGYVVSGKDIIGCLHTHFRDRLKKEKLIYDHLKITDKSVFWKDAEFNHIIFCEGFQAEDNPYFNWIPFKHAKGELVIIETAEKTQPEGILNFGKWLQPLDNGLWKVGSTFEWEDINTEPSTKGLEELSTALEQYSPMRYTVKNHFAGVRPVVRDLHPFIGKHPQESRLSILNGLGAKGFLYAPFCVQLLIDHLLINTPIPPAYSIKRFL